MIDAAEFRRALYYFKEKKTFFSECPSHRDMFRKYIENGWLPDDYELIEPLLLDKSNLEVLLKKYTDIIKENFSVEKIILVEIKAVEYCLDKETITLFNKDKVKNVNEKIDYCFDFFLKQLEGCHIIEFPEYVVGDAYHKWGRGILHYVQDYYDYAFESLNFITMEFERSIEKEVLVSIKHKYEALMKRKYDQYFYKTIGEVRELTQKATKYVEYKNCFKKIILENGKEKIHEAIVHNEIRSCALYGNTEITRLYLEWFKEWGILVEYIVENYTTSDSFNGIQLIKREDKLPYVDVMIIMDWRIEEIRLKIEKAKCCKKAFDYNELIDK